MLSHLTGSGGFLAEELSGIKVNTDIISVCDFQPQNAGYIHKDSFLSLKVL
jgi:hypothetical protein